MSDTSWHFAVDACVCNDNTVCEIVYPLNVFIVSIHTYLSYTRHNNVYTTNTMTFYGRSRYKRIHSFAVIHSFIVNGMMGIHSWLSQVYRTKFKRFKLKNWMSLFIFLNAMSELEWKRNYIDF